MMHSVQWKNLPATQTLSEFYRIAPNALWLDKALALTGVWYECYLCPWEFLLLVYIYGTLPCRLIGYKSIASRTRHQARTTVYRTMQNGNCILYRYIPCLTHQWLLHQYPVYYWSSKRRWDGETIHCKGQNKVSAIWSLWYHGIWSFKYTIHLINI